MVERPLTCAQARRLSHLELDGTLSAAQSDALRAHCDQCAACRRDRQGLFALQTDLIRARFAFRRRVPHPPDVSRRVIASLHGLPRRHPWANLSGVLARATALTAVVVIAAGWQSRAPLGATDTPSAHPQPPATALVAAPAQGRHVAQARIPAFEFEDELGETLRFVVPPDGSAESDPSAPDVPSGPVRLRMN